MEHAEQEQFFGESTHIKKQSDVRQDAQEGFAAPNEHVDSLVYGDLGMPPPCPTLLRQKATDFTVVKERKQAVFANRRKQISFLGQELRTGTQSSLSRAQRLSIPSAGRCPVIM